MHGLAERTWTLRHLKSGFITNPSAMILVRLHLSFLGSQFLNLQNYDIDD